MARQFDPSESGYVDVAARIVEFRTKHPDGSLQPANLDKPYELLTVGSDTYIVVVAAAYRTPDDPRPGIGMAYEPYPGRTPYTRGSELQNAETSAWGRAIVAALAADTRQGVASADEVRNRRAEREAEQPAMRQRLIAKARQHIAEAPDLETLAKLRTRTDELERNGTLDAEDAQRLYALIGARETEMTTQAGE